MTFQEKSAKEVDRFPCQETEFLSSSQESNNGPIWV